MRLNIIFLLLIVPLISKSQNYLWDVGFAVGTSHYLGDIGGLSVGSNSGFIDTQLPATRFTVGAFARRRFSYRWAFNMKLNYAMLYGADELSKGTSRENRNLSFRNNLIENAYRIEYYPLIFNDLGGKKRFKQDLFFSIHAGLGVIYHNPRAKLNNQWYNLRPLQTEGVSYSPIQPVFPIGFGLFTTKKKKGEKLRRSRFGVEVDVRFTLTDYLDDVSTTYVDPNSLSNSIARNLYYRGWELNGQTDPSTRTYPREGRIRGNPSNNDSYYTIIFTYSRILARGKRKFSDQRYGYQFGGRYGKSRKAKF